MSDRFLPALSSVNNASSRLELERFLDDIRFAKNASTQQLQNLSGRVQAGRRLAELSTAQSRLNASVPAAAAAAALLNSKRQITEEVRVKIADVLLLYERCHDAKEMVDQVIELRDCLQGCYMAMEQRDWERAAILVDRARQVPESVANSDFALKTVPYTEQPEAPLVTLRAACKDLADLFTREFHAATKAKNMERVSFYFKLFPLVGYSEQGLTAYAKFISQAIAGLARHVLQSSSTKMRQTPTFYSAVLTNVLENVAAIVEQHTPIVSRHYEPSAMATTVMPIIQLEVNKQAGLIIDTFWDERRMELLLNTVRSYQYPVLANSFVHNSSGTTPNSTNNTSVDIDESIEDLQEASARLSEIGTILNRWALFSAFVQRSESSSDAKTTPDATNATSNSYRDFANNKDAEDKMNTLLGPTFATLSLYVFRRSVERAVNIDELPTKQQINANQVFSEENPLVSSLVDDVMYVFNQLLLQTVETGNSTTASSSLVGLRRVLDSDLVGTLQRKLQASSPVDTLASRGEFGGIGSFMVYLNDLQLLIQYTNEALTRAEAMPEANKTKGLLPKLDQMKRGFTNLATELLADGVQTVCHKRTLPQMRQLVTTHFKIANYTQTASETPTQISVNALAQAWRQFFAPFRQLLHPKIVIKILEKTASDTSENLQRFVWSLQTRLTESGALLLDKDIGSTIALLCETQFGLRRQFAKLAQITTFLVDETADLDLLTEDEQSKLAQMQRAIVKS